MYIRNISQMKMSFQQLKCHLKVQFFFLNWKRDGRKCINKGNISHTLKCMNAKYIYIAVTQIDLLLNQTIVAGGKAIKKVNCLMILNETYL